MPSLPCIREKLKNSCLRHALLPPVCARASLGVHMCQVLSAAPSWKLVLSPLSLVNKNWHRLNGQEAAILKSSWHQISYEFVSHESLGWWRAQSSPHVVPLMVNHTGALPCSSWGLRSYSWWVHSFCPDVLAQSCPWPCWDFPSSCFESEAQGVSSGEWLLHVEEKILCPFSQVMLLALRFLLVQRWSCSQS